MSELGRLITEARTAKELSLAEVEKATRIRQKYLAAFEQGDYASLPRGAIARGFLRNLADFLGLDPAAVLQQYTQESGDAADETMIAEIGKPRLVDYRPAEIELLDTRPDLSWVHWAVALALIALLAIAGGWFLGREGGVNLLSAFGPAPAPTLTVAPSITPTPWIITATPTSAPGAALAATPTSDLLPLPTPTVPPTATPPPRPTATPEVLAQIAVEVRVDQRAWLRVTADNVMVLEGTLEPGQTRAWEAKNALSILTGNAGGVTLILNGADLGKLGSVGQVVERLWVVDQGQVLERSTTPGAPPATPTPTPAG